MTTGTQCVAIASQLQSPQYTPSPKYNTKAPHLQLLVGKRLAHGVHESGAGLLPQGRQRAQQQRQLRRGKAGQLRLRLPVGRLQGGMRVCPSVSDTLTSLQPSRGTTHAAALYSVPAPTNDHKHVCAFHLTPLAPHSRRHPDILRVSQSRTWRKEAGASYCRRARASSVSASCWGDRAGSRRPAIAASRSTSPDARTSARSASLWNNRVRISQAIDISHLLISNKIKLGTSKRHKSSEHAQQQRCMQYAEACSAYGVVCSTAPEVGVDCRQAGQRRHN